MSADAVTASVHVAAEPPVVFEYFTRPELLVRWIGHRAALTPSPGGEFSVDIDSVEVRGKYLEVDAPHRLVISWGHNGSAQLPPEASMLEIRFERSNGGTLVTVIHTGLSAAEVDGHRKGWLRFLPRLPATVTGSEGTGGGAVTASSPAPTSLS